MQKFADFIVRKRWYVLVVWVVFAGLVVGFSPSLSSVESNNENNFIPKSYESVKALNIAKSITPHSQDGSDFIVFTNRADTPLSLSDKQQISSVIDSLSSAHLTHIVSVTSMTRLLAPNGKVQLATVLYSGDPNDTSTINSVPIVRSKVQSLISGTDLTANMTGQESVSYDTQGQSNHALKIVSIGTILLVLILPALIFRSPLAGLLPILSVGIVDVIATSLIADFAKLFDFKVNQQLSVIFTVVLFGIGTDYILFLLFRYRERLREGDHTRGAVTFALSRAGLAILSAALVVLSSFAALFFASFGIFSSMAPGLVVCVAVMMLAALTLVPALVAIVGQKVFWPSKAWMSKSLIPTVSKRIGGSIARTPQLTGGLVVVVLILLGAFILGYKADFSSFSKPPAGTESARGNSELLSAFPAGEANPAQVYVTGDLTLTPAVLQPLEQKLLATQGVASVLPPLINSSSKTAELSVILKDNPYSSQAINDVSGPIRTAAHGVYGGSEHVYVGGASAIFADIEKVTTRDLKVVFPIAAVFIFIILTLLLRSLIAPIFLLLGIGLGYMATLGSTVLIFIHAAGNPGLIFFIPIFMYIFVVAIGTDYNILTITRLKEEIAGGKDPRLAADLTVEHSSATVASAGLILAATFGSLLLTGISFLDQMGSAVAIGVILAAFVIAPFLIPSISALLGYTIWWPGHRPNLKTKT